MKYKLQDIAEVTMGQSPKSEFYNTDGNGIPFLQGNRTFGLKYPTFDTFTTMVTKIAKAGDVIMSVRAPVGDLNITPVDICLGRGVCSLRMKNGNQEFLYYMMKYYMPQLINKESGTVFGSVNRNDINGLEIDIPDDIERQRKIARLLAMIDEKIQVNGEINNNLEQQAFALFDNMLSNKMNGDCLLSDIAVLNPKRILAKNTSARYIDMSQLSTSGCFPNGWEIRPYNGGMRFSNGDTLLARITPCLENGKTAFINFLDEEEIAFGSTEYIVMCSKGKYPPEFFYCLARYPSFVNYAIKNMNGSSGRQRVSAETIGKFKLPAISESDINFFKSIASLLFTIIKLKSLENIFLGQLRDTILPKLMSGMLDVSEIDL